MGIVPKTFLNNIIALYYTCGNHASINYGTAHNYLLCFEKNLPQLKILAPYLVWNMLPFEIPFLIKNFNMISLILCHYELVICVCN